jgi:hypothetical protein
MSVRTVPNYSLLVGVLLLSAGCASSPSTPSASRGQEGGAGGPLPPAATQPVPASAGAAADPVSGEAAPAGGGPGAAAAAGANGNGPGQTSEERRAALDKRLNDSLGSFDAELRTEQQRVAQERDARRAAAAGSATVEGQAADKSGESPGTASTEAPPEDTDKPGASGRHGGTAKRRDPSGDLKSEKASKKPDDNAGNGASAREIPDGSDDDVVARRLRQAAQQETDPELKEKLWQEYIDYKKNAQGK